MEELGPFITCKDDSAIKKMNLVFKRNSLKWFCRSEKGLKRDLKCFFVVDPKLNSGQVNLCLIDFCV